MSRQAFWRWHGLLPAILFLGLVAALHYSHGDLAIADALFDPSSGLFLYQDNPTITAIHDAEHDLVLGITAFIGLIGLGSLLFKPLRPWRRATVYLLLSIALGSGLVAAGKAVSNVDCPRQLLRYGGDLPYIPVFADKPDELPQGRCFPGGHSSGGFSLLALYFLLYGRRRAWLALLPGLSLGLLFAVTQWTRGAHFPSHDLWSAAVCWFSALGVYAGVFRYRLRLPDCAPSRTISALTAG